VTFDFTKEQIQCAGMGDVKKADEQIMLQVIKAFKPSPSMQTIIEQIKESFGEDQSDVICLHHRDGKDWHDHCKRWKAASDVDGIYRGNCLSAPGQSFVRSLENRGLTDSKMIYYCGDHDPPPGLSSHKVVSWRTDMSDENKRTLNKMKEGDLRDLYALVDFQVCNSIGHFIGNSVSTFSALQIAFRDGDNSFWYNSQSVPLQNIWNVYQIPIVYTFTEMSEEAGILLLEASIKSVRKHMPNNKIHVLYHGTSNELFRSWLTEHGVIIHQHEPDWKDDIETMRKNGDQYTSHLFSHPGNYFGTWQRIDIPNEIDYEYCLLLDADTIITKPFTLNDFGLDITNGIAMSTERNRDGKPNNAGVMVMNIPKLRETFSDFKAFILEHVSIAEFDSVSPSDQGAYLDFYRLNLDFLSEDFNYKPYWMPDSWQSRVPFIMHFHGAKPHNYILSMMPGVECANSIKRFCESGPRSPYHCHSMHEFSSVVDINRYCKANFKEAKQVAFCEKYLSKMADGGNNCLNSVSFTYALLREIVMRECAMIKREIQRTGRMIKRQTRRHGKTMFLLLIGIICFVVALVRRAYTSKLPVAQRCYRGWHVIKIRMLHFLPSFFHISRQKSR